MEKMCMKILNWVQKSRKEETTHTEEKASQRETCLAALKTCFMREEISWEAGCGQNQLY